MTFSPETGLIKTTTCSKISIKSVINQYGWGMFCLFNMHSHVSKIIMSLIDGLVQYCSNSIANALELLQY